MFLNGLCWYYQLKSEDKVAVRKGAGCGFGYTNSLLDCVWKTVNIITLGEELEDQKAKISVPALQPTNFMTWTFVSYIFGSPFGHL